MKTLLLTCLTALATLMKADAMEEVFFVAGETDHRMQQEYTFLRETIADLQAHEGARPEINYVWNPSHSVIIFFAPFPPSGSYHCRFWVYKKNVKGIWEKVGTYDFCTRHGMDPDWEHATLSIQDKGFTFSYRDRDTPVSYFYDFSKKEDCFEYRNTVIE